MDDWVDFDYDEDYDSVVMNWMRSDKELDGDYVDMMSPGMELFDDHSMDMELYEKLV